MRKPPKKEHFFCVGVIATAHGIKGEVTVKTFIEIPKNILEYGALVNMQDAPFSFVSIRPTKKGLICKIDGVKTRNDAEALRGTCLYASNEALADLSDDDIYLEDLIGSKLQRVDGTFFGTIRNHFDNGAQTIVTVKMPEEGVKDVLIPFTDNLIVKINHATNEITVSAMADEFAELTE